MYLENRLIAMLDVLGFSSRIKTREGMEQMDAKYAQLIDCAKSHMFSPRSVSGSPEPPEPNFEYGSFVFDTLVLVSYPTDIKSTYRFVFATIWLMEKFFAEGFPLRGSIGIGDFCENEKSGIFLSNAFRRLSEDEKDQQWTGCVLLPEADETVVSSLLGVIAQGAAKKSSPIHYLKVPTKRSPCESSSRWCLNWSHFLSGSVIQAELEQMAGDYAKQQNTIQYLKLLGEMSDDTQPLAPVFAPAQRMKTMKALSGMRVKFEDEFGNGVIPGCSFTLAACDIDAQPIIPLDLAQKAAEGR